MHKYQNIIDQCDQATRSVSALLDESQLNDALDYINKFDEWKLGLEFVIDWLVEGGAKVSDMQYQLFHLAFESMNCTNDSRLLQLKLLCDPA